MTAFNLVIFWIILFLLVELLFSIGLNRKLRVARFRAEMDRLRNRQIRTNLEQIFNHITYKKKSGHPITNIFK